MADSMLTARYDDRVGGIAMKYIYKVCSDCGYALYRGSVDEDGFIDVCEEYLGNGEWESSEFADDVMHGWCTSQIVPESGVKKIMKEVDAKKS